MWKSLQNYFIRRFNSYVALSHKYIHLIYMQLQSLQVILSHDNDFNFFIYAKQRPTSILDESWKRTKLVSVRRGTSYNETLETSRWNTHSFWVLEIDFLPLQESDIQEEICREWNALFILIFDILILIPA